MLDLSDLEELLSSRLPAGHPAGDEFASFEEFCDEVEKLLGVVALDDDLLGSAYDSWAADETAQEFASKHQ